LSYNTAMIERRIYKEIEIESGYEGVYIGDDIIILGDAEIWHMPERDLGKLGICPPTDIIQIYTILADGEKYMMSTWTGDPRVSFKEKA